MSTTPFKVQSIDEQIKHAIITMIPDAEVEVNGGGGHFSITVVSSEFKGKTTLNKQRLVYSAISNLMAGPDAPVHAIDRMKTLIP